MLRGDGMAEHNDKLKNHVQAARAWLGKAERSLEQDNELKSNLNLMLAQAELQRAKETKGTGLEWFSQAGLLIRSIMIIIVVGFIIVFGFSGLDADKAKVPVDSIRPSRIESPQVIAPRENQMLPDKITEEKPTAELPAPVSQPVSAAKQEVSQVKEPAATGSKPEVKSVVSAEEMQQLMRSAGKSLRGQS